MLAETARIANKTENAAYPMIVPRTPPAYAADMDEVLNPYSEVYIVPMVAFCTPCQTRLFAPYINLERQSAILDLGRALSTVEKFTQRILPAGR